MQECEIFTCNEEKKTQIIQLNHKAAREVQAQFFVSEDSRGDFSKMFHRLKQLEAKIMSYPEKPGLERQREVEPTPCLECCH